MHAKIDTVFIPALLCDTQLYDQLIETLGDKIAPSVLMSPKPDLAESAADILRRAPARFVLVGTSYGANLALEIALAAPERVSGLLLMGCDAGPASQGGPDLASGLDATPDAVIDMLAGLVVRPVDKASAAVFKTMATRVGGTAGAAQARALASRKDHAHDLTTLAMPTLLIWGTEDALVPAVTGEKMAAQIPNATFHTLPDCGHLPALEQPGATARLLSAFLDQIETSNPGSR